MITARYKRNEIDTHHTEAVVEDRAGAAGLRRVYLLDPPDGLLGVTWPSMRADCALPLDARGNLLAASTTSNLTPSFLSGCIMARPGIGGLLVTSEAAARGP